MPNTSFQRTLTCVAGYWRPRGAVTHPRQRAGDG
jgi:hypothetical protein